MRKCLVVAWVAVLSCLSSAQTPAVPVRSGDNLPSDHVPSDHVSPDSSLKEMFDAKIKAEWEAIKNKDKKAYGDLLADDYQGVEVDGRGERTKLQAVSELAGGNVFNYTLFGLKLIPAGPDAVLVIYESTMQFPPKSPVRYSRVYISELWTKRDGQWKEVHYQETHVK